MAVATGLPPRGDWDKFTVGLWVYGRRRSGSTTLASTASNMAYKDPDCKLKDPEYRTAREAAEMVKNGWDETSRRYPDDDAAWAEAEHNEAKLAYMWNADILWMDDLHLSDVSGTFTHNHLLPRLVQRVKDGQATVVATSLTSDQLGENLLVVQDLFVMVETNRAVR